MTSKRVEIFALYPYRENESPTEWTNRVLKEVGPYGVNRQCSIAWHDECSNPHGDICMCLCHDPEYTFYSVEGHSEAGKIHITRTKKGKKSWPPKDGEPPTMWAWYVLARSKKDAKKRATAMQSKILDEKND